MFPALAIGSATAPLAAGLGWNSIIVFGLVAALILGGIWYFFLRKKKKGSE